MKKNGKRLKTVSSNFVWNYVPARKEHKKNRAKGGIITATRRNLKEVVVREISNAVVECKPEYNGNKWRLTTVYSKKIEEMLEAVMKWIPERNEEYLLIEGDFNTRTENGESPIKEEEKEEKGEIRISIDKVVNKEGRILLNKIGERGWMILNGSFGNEGEWTYIWETKSSVINYVVGNDRAVKEIKRVREDNKTESDHIPMEVELIGPQTNRRGKKSKLK